MSRPTQRILLAVLLAGAVAIPVAQHARAQSNDPDPKGSGQGGTPQQQTPQVEPEADAVLRSMSTFLAGLSSFSVQADHEIEVVLTSGEKLGFEAESFIRVRRPDRLRSDRRGPLADLSFFYDGKSITLFGNKTHYFATIAAPGNIDDAIDFAEDQLDLEPAGADLLYADAYKELMGDVVTGIYVQKEEIRDTVVHHLAYRGTQTDWEVWVQDGKTPLPLKFAIVSKTEKSQPEFQVELHDWVLDPTLGDDVFTFVAPKDAQQIPFVTPSSSPATAQ